MASGLPDKRGRFPVGRRACKGGLQAKVGGEEMDWGSAKEG